jgi:hypothetical protein
MDGINVHAVIIDKLHMNKTPEVWNVLETAPAARAALVSAVTGAEGVSHSGVASTRPMNPGATGRL